MVAVMAESTSTHMIAAAPSSSESADDACLTRMSLYCKERRSAEVITMHWSDAHARLADESHITLIQLLGYDSRRHLPDLTTDLVPWRGVYKS